MTTFSGLTAGLADRYRIERELGRGGMATVYLARDVKHQRSVALKVLASTRSTCAHFPAADRVRQCRTQGGTEPLWSRDGCRLFYRNGSQLVAAGCTTAPAFAVTSRQILFSGSFDLHAFHPNYDVAPDGRHFVMITSGNTEPQVMVVTNWSEELRQRPGKR